MFILAVAVVASIFVAISSTAPAIPEPTVEDAASPSKFDSDDFMTSTVNHKSNDTIDFVGILECLIDIGRNVAHEYELTAVWAAHAPAFQTYLKDLKECASTDDSNEDEAVEECYGVAAYREFMNLLKELNEMAAAKMLRLYNSVCVNGEPKESPISEFASIEEEQNRLRCVMNAGDGFIRTTSLNELWQSYKADLFEALDRWTQCKDRESATEFAICSAAKARNVEDTVRQFVFLLSISHEKYSRLIEVLRVQIRRDCIAETSRSEFLKNVI